MKGCKTNIKPHREKGVEIEMTGDCKAFAEKLLENLGPVSKRYWKGKMVFLDEESESIS